MSSLGAREIVIPAPEPESKGEGQGPSCVVRPQSSPSPTACPRARLCTYSHRHAFAILLTQCPLGRPNVHPGRTTSSKPDPLAPTYLEKSVTLARHPSPAQPHPIPLTSHLFLTPAPFLPINPLQSRNFASPLEAYAHTCYPRPREGPTQRPGNPTHKRGVMSQASCRGLPSWVPCGSEVHGRVDPGSAPPVLLCHTVPLSLSQNATLRQYRFAQVRRHASAMRGTECRGN